MYVCRIEKQIMGAEGRALFAKIKLLLRLPRLLRLWGGPQKVLGGFCPQALPALP